MRRDHRRLQDVVLIRDVADRLKKLLRVLNEGDECAERERLMRGCGLHHAIAAEPDDERNADCADQIHEREEDRVVKDRLDVRVAIVVVQIVKLLERLRFAVEQLHGLRAR